MVVRPVYGERDSLDKNSTLVGKEKKSLMETARQALSGSWLFGGRRKNERKEHFFEKGINEEYILFSRYGNIPICSLMGQDNSDAVDYSKHVRIGPVFLGDSEPMSSNVDSCLTFKNSLPHEETLGNLLDSPISTSKSFPLDASHKVRQTIQSRGINLVKSDGNVVVGTDGQTNKIDESKVKYGSIGSFFSCLSVSKTKNMASDGNNSAPIYNSTTDCSTLLDSSFKTLDESTGSESLPEKNNIDAQIGAEKGVNNLIEAFEGRDGVTVESRYINTICVDWNDGGLDVSSEERTNLVICHGFGAGIGFFYKNIGPISRQAPNVRVYALDWLGKGRSGRPPFPKYEPSLQYNKTNLDGRTSISLPQPNESTSTITEQTDSSLSSHPEEAISFFLDAFEEWRERAGLEKFVLMGHSMGGYLSAIYALRNPHRVQKLILASPVGLPEQRKEDAGTIVTGRRLPGWIARMWDANYTPQGVMRALGPIGSSFASGYINTRFSKVILDPEERAVLGKYLYQISTNQGSGEYALAALLAPGAWAREPLHSRLGNIQMPTVFLYGQQDWMDRRHAEAAAAQMKVPCRIESLEGADHHLYLDNSEEFNRILIEELTLVSQDSASKIPLDSP